MTPVGSLKYAAGKWTIADIAPHAIQRLKAMFPKIPKAAGPPYNFPNTLDTAEDLLWFESRYALAMDPIDRATLSAMVAKLNRQRETLEKVVTGEYVRPLDAGWREWHPTRGTRNELRHYQKLAVDVLSGSKSLLLVDEMGLGKTVVGATACLIDGALPAAIVCQRHLQKQWKDEIESFTTLSTYVANYTTPPKSGTKNIKADVVIFSYTQIQGWADSFEAMGFNSVVFDEVQELRTGEGTEKAPIQKGVAARRLVDQCTFKLGLSATPIYNYGTEIYNIMSMIKPEMFGERVGFMNEWAPNGTILDPAALSSYLKDQHVFLRRTKRDVGKEMPVINRIVQNIDFEESTMRHAEVMARELAARAKDVTRSVAERGNAMRELDMRLRAETGCAKARAIANFIRMIVEGGEPVVVFLWHRPVYAIIMKALADLKPAMYTGSETTKQKEFEKDRFLNGETDVLLMSLRSGAGLDGLQNRCSTGIIGELDWSPGVHAQCLGRLDRPGQANPVTAFYLVIDEGSDGPMQDMLGLKASQAAALIDNGLTQGAPVSDVSRLQVLVQRYLTKKAA